MYSTIFGEELKEGKKTVVLRRDFEKSHEVTHIILLEPRNYMNQHFEHINYMLACVVHR
jgi:hypothetical protein